MLTDNMDLEDLYTMLQEENWNIVDESNTCVYFKKFNKDYDYISIKLTPGGKYSITIPLPTTKGAYYTHFDNPIKLYTYVSDFIEYYDGNK